MARLHIEVEVLWEKVQHLLLVKGMLVRREDENGVLPTSQTEARLNAVREVYTAAEAGVEDQLRRVSDAIKGARC